MLIHKALQHETGTTIIDTGSRPFISNGTQYHLEPSTTWITVPPGSLPPPPYPRATIGRLGNN